MQRVCDGTHFFTMDFSLPFLNLDTTNLLGTNEETSDIDAMYNVPKEHTTYFQNTNIHESIISFAIEVRKNYSITTTPQNWIVVDGSNVFYRDTETKQLGNSFDRFLRPEYNYLRGTSQVVVVFSREAWNGSFKDNMDQNWSGILNIFSEIVTTRPASEGVEAQTFRAPVVIAVVDLLSCKKAGRGVPCLRRAGKQRNPQTGNMEPVCSIRTPNPPNPPNPPNSSRSSRNRKPYNRPTSSDEEPWDGPPFEHKWCEFDDIVAAGTLAYLREKYRNIPEGGQKVLFTHETRLEDEAYRNYQEMINTLQNMGSKATLILRAYYQA